ncbi:LysE/ArgO family amino acid transporter [Compostimonas suwonensis]|uniref:L-lysine exporter family protein LysE/ArgO n=1 Tax=Compostimonas suwonensis TaxID=1048394 RepID=A0A2M9BB28_9MICO|nr:LysE/ArgO family amino acid transporter [Compostimonas suwonensis]PJJ55152.1 L-lysine exporter family protein LysE/ArgO [Compostimonas suwonensis]
MTSSPALLVALSGFAAGASLIIAIGAQNAFVLRQGLRREHVLVVVAICALSDAILIALGIAGIGALVTTAPVVLDIVRWLGAGFLIAYAVFAARRAIRPGRLDAGGPAATTLAAAVLTCLALTWLNPHVYLDTVLLLGSLASTHGDTGRWIFGAGAVLASILWFAGLGHGARLLSRFFARPLAWRILDAAIAVVMFTLGVLLLVPVLAPLFS